MASACKGSCSAVLAVASVRSPIGSMRRHDLTSRSFQIHRRLFAGAADSCDERLYGSLPCGNSQNVASFRESGDPCAGRRQMSFGRVASVRPSPRPSLMVHWLSRVAASSFTGKAFTAAIQ